MAESGSSEKRRGCFINFRTYSDYSLGYSCAKVSDLIDHAAKNEIPALVIADKYNLFVSLEFALSCAKQGVQPIIGCTVRVIADNMNPYDESEVPELLLIAMNKEGYENLVKLVSNSYLAPEYENLPSINYNSLRNKSDGIAALYGGKQSNAEILCRKGKESLIVEDVLNLKEIFTDRLYIEISRNKKYTEEYKVQKILLDIAAKHEIPIIGTSETTFISEDQFKAADALVCIANSRYVVEAERPKSNPYSYFKSYTEILDLFADLPEAVENTMVLARRCCYFPTERAPILPSYPDLKPGNTLKDELAEQANAGLKTKLAKLHAANYYEVNDEEYQKRLDYEITVINNMDFPGYFLIVSDFIKWSKANNIPVGPGRGSGAGSLVAWCLEITDLDPLRYGLLFERFLNPDRVSMPDFDIDFCQERRDEVIDYVKNKYGHSQVAQIITFGKLQARAVLRDVGRVLQLPYGLVDRICKMVPNNPANPVTLAEAIALDRELQRMQREDPQIEELLNISLMLEGTNRHVSTHAAGIVIADRPLIDLLPIYKDENTMMPAVQYSMKYAEKAGLVKFDFLGLKTLTVISWCVNLIQKRHNGSFKIDEIPHGDQKAYDLLTSGNTIGVFQFEGAGMREAIKKLKPSQLEDLIALGSLYRPGPMDNIPHYINRKHGLEEAHYLHPKLEKILEETYGIIVYQEQVIQIAQDLAGFTLGGADLLRRAMGKKIKSEMEALRQQFIDGAIANSITRELAEEVFDLVNKFASYGFNKSHAAAYAVISYQTAYLKANYPLEYIVSSINLEIDDTDKINRFIEDAKREKLDIMLPDINLSEAYCSAQDDKLVYGLAALKGVGLKVTQEIIDLRREDGPFADIYDFTARASGVINKRIMESLVKAGALDSLLPRAAGDRKSVVDNLDALLKYSALTAEESKSTQVMLFAEDEVNSQAFTLPANHAVWNKDELLQKEYEAIGFYLSQHPLSEHISKLDKLGISYSAEVEACTSTKGLRLHLAGVLISKKIRSSKRGKYAFLQISDPRGMLEISIFDEFVLQQNEALLKVGRPLYFDAEARREDSGLRVTVSSVKDLSAVLKDVRFCYEIKILDHAKYDVLKQQIVNLKEDQQLVQENRNRYHPLRLLVVADGGEVQLSLPDHFAIANDSDIITKTPQGIEVREVF